MYRRLTDGDSLCLPRLVVKHTFVEFECPDDSDDDIYQFLSRPRRNSEPPPTTDFKYTEGTSTPTTCGSNHSEEEAMTDSEPPSPTRSRSPTKSPRRVRSPGRVRSPARVRSPVRPKLRQHVDPDSQPETRAEHSSYSGDSGGYNDAEDQRDMFRPARQRVPTSPQEEDNFAQANEDSGDKTTLMVCNLSTDMTQADLVAKLIEEGCRGKFDFVYLPMNLRTCGNFGYGFINCTAPTAALQVVGRLQNLLQAEKLWQVSWSSCQGLTANIERNRNSPLMHPIVPAHCRPALYNELGDRVPFPAPTKTIRKPRIHLSSSS